FDGALSLSYATRLSQTLSGGLTGKIIYSRLADQGAGAEIGSGSATAFAIDAGILYQTPWDPLTFGAALSNVGPNISYIDAQQSDPLPRNLALGFGLKLLDRPAFRVLWVGDINRELVDLTDSDNELAQNIYNTGLELSYLSTLALRGGYVHDQDGDIKVFTAGIGLSYQNVKIDVAYIPSTGDSPLSNTPRYSLSARF
ncbi:MAG: PorV/PorQ family protein, partial [candidate division Zixibacteria bacterium]|nr:PorV/PorQ family protein [candidate division Zixibacteria bacterium]